MTLYQPACPMADDVTVLRRIIKKTWVTARLIFSTKISKSPTKCRLLELRSVLVASQFRGTNTLMQMRHSPSSWKRALLRFEHPASPLQKQGLHPGRLVVFSIVGKHVSYPNTAIWCDCKLDQLTWSYSLCTQTLALSLVPDPGHILDSPPPNIEV